MANKIKIDLQTKTSNRQRIKLMMSLIVFGYLLLCARIIDVCLFFIADINSSYHPEQEGSLRRSPILDTNGVVIAKNVGTLSIYAHPNQITDPIVAASSIAKILNIDERTLKKKLTSSKNFVWIKRHVSPAIQQKIEEIGILGVYSLNDEKRFYPQGSLCSHVVGYLDIDGNGLAGIERGLNERLRNNPDTPINLALDLRVQSIVYAELASAVRDHGAIGGSAIVLDLADGGIVSMVNLPDFDPNKVKNSTQKGIFNTATLGILEMGSVFKALTVAMALDSGAVKLNDSFDVSAPFVMGRYKIKDYRGKGGIISLPEALMYSSNIAIAQISERLGSSRQKKYMKTLGLLDPITTEIKETGRPMYPREEQWKNVATVTIGYGHGIAVTPLHTVRALGAVVNGGTLPDISFLKKISRIVDVIKRSDENLVENKEGENKKNIFIKNINIGHESNEILLKTKFYDKINENDNYNETRVFSIQTSLLMRKILRLTTMYGFASKSNIDEYLVGMKTGTAEKVAHNGRGYSKDRNIAYCAGAFPINKPRYVIYVAIDEPKRNKLNGGFATGGMVAAPLAGKIVQQIGPILGLPMQNFDDPEVTKALHLDFKNYREMLAKKAN